MKIELYHGTSSKVLEDINKQGFIKAGFYTSEADIAQYYAECCAEEDESQFCVLTVRVDTEQLKADLPSFSEPLTYILDAHNMSEEDWFEAIDNDNIDIPQLKDWQYSLDMVKSVYCPHTISVDNIVYVFKENKIKKSPI